MPIWNNILETCILPISDILTGSIYFKNLKQLRKIQHYSQKELEILQKNKLMEILTHATKYIDFYKEQSLNSDDPYVELKKFPIMYKDTIKNNLSSLVLNNDYSQLIEQKSSGSSGIQSSVFMSKHELSRTQSIQTLWWEWAGYRYGNKILQTGMTLNRGFIKKIKDILLSTTYVSAFQLDEKTILKILQELEKKPKEHMGGYASSIYLFAKIAKDNNLKDIHFDSIFSWGDKMFPHYRKLIEEQFHTKVFDTYGSTEGLMIASQCNKGSYHIMSPHIYLEILDEEGNDVKDGEIGYVVVTRLDAFHMPLIRYYLGDLAVKADKNEMCSCGMKLPLLKKVIGRDTDIVKTSSGKYMIVHFFTAIFEYIPEIKQFQIVQKHLNGIDILYIPAKNFNEKILNTIKKQILEYLNEIFEINFIEVHKIEATASGKPQIIKSFLEKNKI